MQTVRLMAYSQLSSQLQNMGMHSPWSKNEPCTNRRRSGLSEILGEGDANRLGQGCHMAVIRVVEADRDVGTRLLECGDLLRREAEADELHRRGFALGAGILSRRVGFA